MDTSDHHGRLQRLGRLMSDLQEECWSASWMCVTPFIVLLCRDALTTGEPQPWGTGTLSVDAAREMWELAESVGAWAEPDGDADEDSYVMGKPFVPLDQPDPGAPCGWDAKDL